MKQKDPCGNLTAHDAAVAAAALVVDEFFPHCPNGVVPVIHDRLSAIIEAAIEAVETARKSNPPKPSDN